MRQGGPACSHRARHVDLVGTFPVLEAGLLEGAVQGGQRCDLNQGIQLPESLLGQIGQFFQAGTVLHVGDLPGHLFATGVELACELLEVTPGARSEDDTRPIAEGFFGDFPPEPRSGTHDDDRFPL